MGWLILGATGLLGQAFGRKLALRGVSVRGAARRGADISLDIADPVALVRLLDREAPNVIVNCAAVTSLDECERNPRFAHDVNAAPLKALASWTRGASAKLIQISTDHYYSGDGARTHDERSPVMLLNQYARSKYVGEVYAGENPDALIVRTNITGARGWRDRPTFSEWAMEAISDRRQVRLFTDYFTSTIDADACAQAVLDLAEADASGVMNVASRDVSDKWSFVHELARQSGVSLSWAQAASVRDMPTPRAESAGLSVARAEAALGRRLPSREEVCAAILAAAGGGVHAV